MSKNRLLNKHKKLCNTYVILMYYVLRPKIVLMLCNLCLMYCISTNLPGPPRHVNHRGEDYYKSATSYSTYLCTAPTTLKAMPTTRQRPSSWTPPPPPHTTGYPHNQRDLLTPKKPSGEGLHGQACTTY